MAIVMLNGALALLFYYPWFTVQKLCGGQRKWLASQNTSSIEFDCGNYGGA
jgi:hypothetical protein